MTGTVLLQRQELPYTNVLIGDAVSSGVTWYPAAFAANWLNGQSAVLVPGVVIDKNVLVGTTGVLHFRAKTRLAAIERIWTLRLRGTVAGTTAVIKAPASSGTAVTVTLGTTIPLVTLPPIIYREILSAQSSSVTDLTIEIAATVGAVVIDSVSCFELARPLLTENGTDFGINETTLRPRERVFDNTGFDSVTGVIGGLLSADPRRVGIYQWAVPEVTPITTTGAYADILTLGMPVLARKLNSGIVNKASVWWSAYAKVSSGSGDVRIITSQSTVSDSVNVTATSFAWTTAREITISAEDMTTADGLIFSAFDELMPSFRANGGVTMSLAGISVWDEAA